jgi:hypothetical protein
MYMHGPHTCTHARTHVLALARSCCSQSRWRIRVCVCAVPPRCGQDTDASWAEGARASLQRPELVQCQLATRSTRSTRSFTATSNFLFNTFSQRSFVTVCDCVTAIQKHDTSRRVSLIHCRMQPTCFPTHLLDTSSAAQWPDNAHSVTQTTV